MYSLFNAAELSGIYVRLLVRTQICVQRYNFFLIYASFFTVLNEILHFMSKKSNNTRHFRSSKIGGYEAEMSRVVFCPAEEFKRQMAIPVRMF